MKDVLPVIAVVAALVGGVALMVLASTSESGRKGDARRFARVCAEHRPLADCEADALKIYQVDSLR